MKCCHICKGKGEVPDYNLRGEGIYNTCSECEGTGEAYDEHISCFSYPNCDIDPLGCVIDGLGEPIGHKD